MEPPPAASDLGTAPWERDLIRAIRERHFLWRREQTYREWAVRFARFIAPRSPMRREVTRSRLSSAGWRCRAGRVPRPRSRRSMPSYSSCRRRCIAISDSWNSPDQPPGAACRPSYIRTVQELMGHASVETTQIYLHVMKKPGLGVRSPLDQ